MAATCGEQRPDSLRSDAVTARRVPAGARPRAEPEAEPAAGPAALPGDWVLESEHLRVVVGGMRRAGRARGRVLSLSRPGGASDERPVGRVTPRVWVGERGYAVIARRMYLVDRAGRPTLRIEGEARAAGRTVDVVRELSLGGSGAWLSSSWRLAPRGERPLEDVRVGMDLRWDGRIPFAPGRGALHDEQWHEASWAGVEGEPASIAAGFHEGATRVRAVYERHGPTRRLAHTDVVSAAATATRQTPATGKSTLVLARGGLSEAVRRFGWSRGAPYPEALATLPYAPEGSFVRVETDEGAPVVRGRPDAKGRVLLPLPPLKPGRRPSGYRLVASAYGHAASAPVPVREGERVAVHIPRGGMIRIAISDADGRVVPARVRIEGLKDTKTPDLGPVWRADGAEDTLVTTSGEASVLAPPGRYRVFVSHGPEWTLVDEVVKVTETFRPRIEARLEHVVDPGPWVPCDFHLHQAPSYDSSITLEDRLASLRAAGVRFAVPTDHNHVTDYGPTIRETEIEDLGTVPGVEVTTWDPQFGHFNVYPYPIEPGEPRNGAPRHLQRTPEGLFTSLRELDPTMAIQVSHPRLEPNIGYFDLVGFDPRTGRARGDYSDEWDVLEVFNGYDIARPEYVERVFQDWMHLLARGRRTVANGSSDSHRIPFYLAGYPRTYVRVPGGRVDDGRAIVAALRAGRAFVTSGPFLELEIDGRGPGEAVRAEEGEVRARVVVRAPPWLHVGWVDLYVGDAIARTIPIETEPGEPWPVTRLDERVRLEVEGDAFVVARARTERTHDEFYGRGGVYPEAFTNPIWVDGDGDGRVPWLDEPVGAPAADVDAGAAP